MSESQMGVVWVLLHRGEAVSPQEITSDLVETGDRISVRTVEEACENLQTDGVIERVQSENSEMTYEMNGFPALVRFYIDARGPLGIPEIEQNVGHLGSDATRDEIEAALDTLLERGEVVETGDDQYDVPE